MQRGSPGVMEAAAIRLGRNQFAPLPRELRVWSQLETIPVPAGRHADPTPSDPLFASRGVGVARPDAGPGASR
jgi:hypothetical protein